MRGRIESGKGRLWNGKEDRFSFTSMLERGRRWKSQGYSYGRLMREAQE